MSLAGSKTPVPEDSVGVQVPPAVGLPPKLSKRLIAFELAHRTAEPLVPAEVTYEILTITELFEEPQGLFRVYVYALAASFIGSKTPVPEASAGDQVPPVSGEPPK